MQWVVLFEVVHPGQHRPPQTFLLWSRQSKVSTRMLRAGTIHTAPLGRDGGILRGPGDCPHPTGRPPGPGMRTVM